MEDLKEDELAVAIPEDLRISNLATVELPLAVKPSNKGIEAALALVGGIEELSKVTADEEKALKMYMRLKDPLCRPMVAQRNASETNSFIFKVKRRRLRSKGDSDVSGSGKGKGEDTPWSIASVTAVGEVHTTFAFNALADAQFLSCRVRDVGEQSIDERIEAAATSTEPMECVPPAFLPPLPRVSQASREEKILRRERKHNDTVKLQRGSLLVYHRFGEAVKHVTKSGAILIRDAKEVEHLRVELDKKWGSGRQRGRKNRPSRYRKGISGHNEVREQRLLLVQKIVELFEKQPMYFMRELEENMQDQPTWPLRDLVPAVAYYYCNGPWRSRWVRFGYRPEDHPSDRFKQILEFRLFPAQLRVWAAALEQAGVKKSRTPKVFAPVGATASPAAKTAPTAAAKAAAAPTGSAGAAVRGGERGASVTVPAAKAASSAPRKGSEGHSSSSSSSCKAGGAAADDANDNNNNTENSNVDDEETETDPPFGDAATTDPAATEHASKKSKTGSSGDSATTATADNKGDQVAEAEMEEEEEGAVGGGGGGRQKDTGLTLTSQRFSVGCVVPEVGLTSRPKGRFASQLVLNGNILSARNRHVVGESPIRAVQELALKAPRMDRPGIVTGWWQQGTIDKMRMLTLEALSTLVKHKKQEMAAAAAAAAAATAGDAGASAGDGGKSAAAGAATTGASSSCLAAAVVPGQAQKGAMRQQQQQQQNKATAAGPSAATVRNPLPAKMSRDEFRRKTRTIAKDVEVVQAPPPAMSESAMDADAYGREGDYGRSGGGAGKAFVTCKSGTRKIGFAGTGGRSGTGRVAGKSAAAGGGGGGKRPAGAAAGGAGGAAAVPASLREADRAVVQSDTDSDEDSESNSVNSSDLVDDTEDSWDSQQDDTSDGDGVSEISEIFGDESSAAEEDDEAKEKVEEKGKGDKSPRTPPSRGGRVAGRGRGKGASASKRSGGSSRRKRS